MLRSNRVDIITAPEAEPIGTVVVGVVEAGGTGAVDVSPEPSVRVIVVAHSKAAGAELAEEQGITPVAVVTPRSAHAARGITADTIVWADDITDEQRATLTPHVAPSLATTEQP